MYRSPTYNALLKEDSLQMTRMLLQAWATIRRHHDKDRTYLSMIPQV